MKKFGVTAQKKIVRKVYTSSVQIPVFELKAPNMADAITNANKILHDYHGEDVVEFSFHIDVREI